MTVVAGKGDEEPSKKIKREKQRYDSDSDEEEEKDAGKISSHL